MILMRVCKKIIIIQRQIFFILQSTQMNLFLNFLIRQGCCQTPRDILNPLNDNARLCEQYHISFTKLIKLSKKRFFNYTRECQPNMLNIEFN